ncbi:hypothetical protein AAMO2058_000086700 [Amorphochlora amoebiformis]
MRGYLIFDLFVINIFDIRYPYLALLIGDIRSRQRLKANELPNIFRREASHPRPRHNYGLSKSEDAPSVGGNGRSASTRAESG